MFKTCEIIYIIYTSLHHYQSVKNTLFSNWLYTILLKESYKIPAWGTRPGYMYLHLAAQLYLRLWPMYQSMNCICRFYTLFYLYMRTMQSLAIILILHKSQLTIIWALRCIKQHLSSQPSHYMPRKIETIFFVFFLNDDKIPVPLYLATGNYTWFTQRHIKKDTHICVK